MLPTVKQYKDNGYYIARQILPADNLQYIIYEMDIIIVQQLNQFGLKEKPSDTITGLHEHMRMLYAKNQFTYIQSLKVWAKLFSIQAIIMHQNIVSIIKSLGIALPLFQTSPVMHIMAADLKITGGYHGVGAHQDWPALQSGLDTITLWIPFMDVDKNNFPVELIPGSHKYGLYPAKISEHIMEVDPKYYREEDFIPMEVNFGDVLFMSNFTLHRSGLQGDTRLRAACSARYENACEKTFIERTYPSAQKRIIQRELISKDFPSAHMLEELYMN